MGSDNSSSSTVHVLCAYLRHSNVQNLSCPASYSVTLSDEVKGMLLVFSSCNKPLNNESLCTFVLRKIMLLVGPCSIPQGKASSVFSCVQQEDLRHSRINLDDVLMHLKCNFNFTVYS